MTFGSEKTGQVQARRGASSVRSLLGSTALVRAGRLAFLSFAISGAIATTSAFADGGGSGGVIGAPDSTLSAGSDGASIGLGGGGGGAGASGGMGGMDSSGHQAAGGKTAGHTSKDGEDGADVSAGAGAGGGGGGAHGFIGDLPAAAITGGAGGNGGNGLSAGSFGGGGGAGGWGAVITTAAGWTGTLTVDLTGGKGGNGGLGVGAGANSGSGGTGGTGLFAANRADLTIDANVTGGKGGDGGWGGGPPIPKLPGTGGDGLSMFAGGTVTVTKNGSVMGGDGGGVGGIGVAGFGGNGIIGADLAVINEGTISAGRSDNPSLQSHAIYFSGGTNVFELRAGGIVNGIVADVTNNGTFRLGGEANSSFDASSIGPAAQYQGFSHFEKTGASVWTLNNTANQRTDWTINGGALALGAGAGLVPTSVITVNAGTFDISGSGANQTVAALSGLAGGTVNLGTHMLTINGGAPGTFGGDITGSGGIIKEGGNTQIFTGTNSFTGDMTIHAGVLALSGAGKFAPTVLVNLTGPGAGFDISGNTLPGVTIGALAGSAGTNVFLAGNTLTFGDGTNQTYAGVISGAGGHLVKQGTGTATLSGANTFTGGVSLNGGGLLLDSSGALGSGALTVNNAASLDTLGPFTLSNAITLNATLTVLGFSNLTLAGALSGAGGLTKDGLTTLTLKGASNYTGATLVNAGTLAAGRGNVFSAGSAFTVASGATLSLGGFDQAIGSLAGAGVVDLGSATLTAGADDSSTTFSGEIAGSGEFTKSGIGTMTLSGVSSFNGSVNVDAGTLVVNGDLSSAQLMFVNPGGTLSGTGTVPFTALDDGATLAPGPVNGIGVLTVKDGVLFCDCSTYAVKVSGTGSDRASIVAGGSGPGDALLDGKVRVTSPTGSYRFNSAYTILSAQGGLNGTTFDSLMTPTGIGGVLSYTSNDVLLTLTSQLGQIAGLNGNQQRVATTLDNAINRLGSVNGLGGIFGGNVPQNLTQVSGELGTASQQTTFQAMNLFMGLITDPFSAGRGVAHNGPTAFADDSESMAYAGRAKSKNPRDAFAAFTKAPAAVFAQHWNVWAAGYGGSQTTDGNAVVGSNNTTSAVYGGVAGADYWFSPDTVAGFALAGGGSNFGVANGGSGRSDMFQAGAFVRHNFDATYLTAAVAYGWQDVTTDRNVSIAGVDHLRANFNANAYSGRLELGHRFLTPWFGGLGVSPYAAAQITAFELPSYAERAISGASTFALNYGADTATSSRTELGLRTDKSYALDGAVLTLRGRAAWAHDFNPDRAITATFQTLPGASFVMNGAALASDSALTTASAEVRWMNGWSVAATFEGEFSDVTRSYAGKGVLRYNW